MLKADIDREVPERQRIESILKQIEAIENAFAMEKRRLDADGQELAVELSERLSAFARAIQAVKNQGLVIRSEGGSQAFPGSSMAEQFERPSVGAFSSDPLRVLMEDFHLSEPVVVLIKTAIPDSPDWDKAAEIVRDIYHVGYGMEKTKIITILPQKISITIL